MVDKNLRFILKVFAARSKTKSSRSTFKAVQPCKARNISAVTPTCPAAVRHKRTHHSVLTPPLSDCEDKSKTPDTNNNKGCLSSNSDVTRKKTPNTQQKSVSKKVGKSKEPETIDANKKKFESPILYLLERYQKNKTEKKVETSALPKTTANSKFQPKFDDDPALFANLYSSLDIREIENIKTGDMYFILGGLYRCYITRDGLRLLELDFVTKKPRVKY